MSEMNGPEFDVVLASALKRVNAPERFAVAVLERASVEAQVRESGPGAPEVVARRKVIAFPKLPVWMSGAIAAVLVMGCLVGARVHVVHQQEQAAATERQFETAIRVTDRALDQTQEQLARAGLKFGD